MKVDIYQILRIEHQKQRDLSAQLLETAGDSDERRKLYQLLVNEATAHANAEEQTFYATLLADEKSQEESRHSVAEHQTIDKHIEKLELIEFSSPAWLPRCRKLVHALEHHLEEEEGKMFAIGKKVISAEQAVELGSTFNERKQLELAELHRS